jgi:FMN phosphatase YigB (HAD superfamily)
MASTPTAKKLEPMSGPPADARLHAAWEAIARPDIKVVSTDIFDTLVWRQVAEPVDAFLLLAERLRQRGRLAPHLSPEAFQSIRRIAEDQARLRRAHASNDLEVTLDEIYEGLPLWLFSDPSGRQVAMDTELALEHELVVPDLDIASLLLAALRAGKRVVAVSDTYFSEAQLRDLLAQPGLEELELERVFSSSEHRCSKVDGLLSVVLEELEVPAGAMVHLGDHEEADIEAARRLGIAAVAFERHPADLAELLRAERRFAEPRPLGGFGSTLQPELTALRGKVAARAEGGALPPSLQPFWRTGALVLGPVFTGFAEWVQERAAEHRLDRLFCFMREGEFLTGLIDRAGQSLDLPARGERLWLNREVLSAASIGDGSRHEIAGLLARRRTPTVADLLRTVGLGLADVPAFASHADTSLDDPAVRQGLLDALDGDRALNARIVEHARSQRERVVAYVESLLGDAAIMGVVDLGWGGSAQRLLQHVLTSAGRELGVVGFYLLTHDGVGPAVSVGMHARGYLGELGAPAHAAKTITRTPEILEQLCMPDHGPQTGLDEKLEPVLAPAFHDRLQMVEAGALRQGVEAFQREWGRYRAVMPGKLPSFSGGAHLLRPLLLRQLEAPTELEASLLGAWSHDENQGSERTEEIADLRQSGRLRHLAPDQLLDVPMEELYWPAGLAARADPAIAALYAAGASEEIPWDSLSSPVETGRFRITAAGTEVPPDGAIEITPKRNRLGLSEVSGRIMAPAIHELILRPSEQPCVLRLDYLEIRCLVEGQEAPLVVDLQRPEDFARLARANCFVLNPNVFVVHSIDPELRLDLSGLTPRTVFRVDVRCGFAILPISQLLPTPGRLKSVEEAGVRLEGLERNIAAMRSSLSWRITKPLRLFKRFTR